MPDNYRSRKGQNKSGPSLGGGGFGPTFGTNQDPLLGPLLNKPKKPKKPPPPPTPQDPAIEDARRRERLRLKRRRGRKATILTGPLGDPSEAPVERKTLLGG